MRSYWRWRRRDWGCARTFLTEPIDGPERPPNRWETRLNERLRRDLHNSCILVLLFGLYRYTDKDRGSWNFMYGIAILRAPHTFDAFHRLSWDIHHGLWPFESFKEILISKTPAKATASQSTRGRSRGTTETCPSSVCVANGDILSQHI